VSLLDHIPPALLVVFRIGGLMIYAPVLGSSVIPVRVKVLLALMLGAAVYPVLAAQHHTAAGLQLSLWTLAPLIAIEVLVGLLIGFLASLPLTSMQIGGVIASQQMGLGFAQLFNPALDEEADVVVQVLYFMALATFLLSGGLDATLLALLHTFERIPAGGLMMSTDLVTLITGLLVSALELGLRIAAPLLCIIFLETVALGFLSKTVPQLNILSLGFPLRILVGLTILALCAVVMNDVVLDEIDSGLATVGSWIDAQ
jgi:flagellar biosynthetic protein FliR